METSQETHSNKFENIQVTSCFTQSQGRGKQEYLHNSPGSKNPSDLPTKVVENLALWINLPPCTNPKTGK